MADALKTRFYHIRNRISQWLLRHQKDPDYRSYLDTQIARSLSKRHHQAGDRAKLLINQLIETGQPGPDARVLCIGSRNTFEIDYFKAQGFADVIGIDLFSEHPTIKVMDMHALTFTDDSFDIIYSAHSLEHAYDSAKVIAEIARVARPGALVAVEVPIHFEPRGSDRIDFGGVEGLIAAFGPHIDRVLWADEQPPKSPTNPEGTSIARLIFRLRPA